jgi:transposase
MSMRKTKEILRLKHEAGLSHRMIAGALGIANSTVSDISRRMKTAGLVYDDVLELSDSELERRLYRDHERREADPREPDWAYVRSELGRKHVTLRLLWAEYCEKHPDGYGYSWFCERFRAWQGKIDVVMRQEHVFGEKLFVDWAGDTIPVIDATTGEVRPAYLFVAVLGASNYLYAEASLSQDTAAFLSAHCRAFEFLGGVPELVVCDNLKTGVKRPDRYEPDIHAPYADLAAHYGVAVLPARVRKPRDKAKVEVGVLVVCRQVLAPLRNRTFFSLAELNEAVGTLVESVNARPFKKLPGSRESVFRKHEAGLLRPLPAEPYFYRTRKEARVHIDYHVELDGHFYSVPWGFAREKVELLFDERTVEVLFKGERVALHPRSRAKGRATTTPSHMPEKHRRQAEWSPERIASWAARTGPATAALTEAIMDSRPHPELGFRSCLGILRLADKYGPGRLEAACTRALSCGARSYRSVHSILERGLDAVALTPTPDTPAPAHDNVRGPGYYA